MNKKLCIFMIAFSLFSTAETITSTSIDPLSSGEIEPKTTKRMHLLFDRIKKNLLKSTITITDFDNNNGTTFSIKWSINRKRIVREVEDILRLYTGENPTTTNTTVKYGVRKRNNLYFYYKPLGQLNGLTFDLSKHGEKSLTYQEILANFKAYIEVKTPFSEYTIPIASTSSSKGCGNITEQSEHKLFCIQTQNPTEEDLTIGYANGYKTTFHLDKSIKEKDITVKWKITYLGAVIK